MDEVGEWSREHSVDIGYAKGGTLTFARSAAQLQRLEHHAHEDQRFGGSDTALLSAEEAAGRVRVTDSRGAMFTPQCAAIQPAKLARGLARIVEQQGVRIYEQTPAIAIEPGTLRTEHATVRADVVIRATEGYTVSLAEHRRAVAPVWSLLIVTEPLPAHVWAEIGWDGRETVTDERHVLIYAQRTADGRIAFGGRGAPYRFGSRTDGARGHAATYRRLEKAFAEMFPAAQQVPIAQRWGGVLAVPRDWMPSVGLDRATGYGWGGGYVGDGVACAALGRTDPGRSGAQARHRAHDAAMGAAPQPALGAGAAAVAGHSRCLGGTGSGRRRGATAGSTVADRRGGRQAARRLTVSW